MNKLRRKIKKLKAKLDGEIINRNYFYKRYQETQDALYGYGGAYEEVVYLQRLCVDHDIPLPPSKLVDLRASYPGAKLSTKGLD